MKTEEDGDADETDRQRRRMLANREPGNDVRGVASLRRTGNFLDRAIAHRRVIICDCDYDGSHHQADYRSEIELRRGAGCASDR